MRPPPHTHSPLPPCRYTVHPPPQQVEAEEEEEEEEAVEADQNFETMLSGLKEDLSDASEDEDEGGSGSGDDDDGPPPLEKGGKQLEASPARKGKDAGKRHLALIAATVF